MAQEAKEIAERVRHARQLETTQTVSLRQEYELNVQLMLGSLHAAPQQLLEFSPAEQWLHSLQIAVGVAPERPPLSVAVEQVLCQLLLVLLLLHLNHRFAQISHKGIEILVPLALRLQHLQ